MSDQRKGEFISNLQLDYLGGGLYISPGASATIENSVFNYNTADGGAGMCLHYENINMTLFAAIYADQTATLTITGCTIEYNAANHSGTYSPAPCLHFFLFIQQEAEFKWHSKAQVFWIQLH